MIGTQQTFSCLLVLLALATGRTVAAEATVVLQADFETPSAMRPPTGWSMWGAQKFKNPADFTRDEQTPHGGLACFRIHHPAGTGGYVVSSPEASIRPKSGTMLTATFWARSDRPGEAMFGWTAYRQVQPFVDAPSPGFFPLAVDQQWRQFRFVLHEGWDFFADDCRHLLLTFRATGRDEEERTLWIDDVVVTQQTSTREGRLINPDTLTYTSLEHRLQPGDELNFVVDAGRRVRETYPEVGGVSFHRVAGWGGLPFDKGGRYVLSDELEEAVRQMRLPMTRFYALGDEPFGLEAAIDKAAEFLDRIGVPHAATPLEFEIQGATSTLSPEAWANGVRHSLERGYRFHRWEIANEPYVGRPSRAFPTPDSYLEHFVTVSQAIRAVDSQAIIGMPIHHRSPGWGNYLLKRAAGHYDFVVGHYYSFADVERASFEDIVLTGNYRILDEILLTNALTKWYNPDRDVYQYDTEWGMHSSGPHGERADYVNRNANIHGMAHRAVRLIHYLREGMLRGASSWEMFTFQRAPGFGFLAQDAPQQRAMNYWLYFYFNRHVGRWVLDIDGTAPYHEGSAGGRTLRGPLTPAVATLSDDGQQIFLMLVNGSWTRPVPCRIELRDFPAQRATGIVLSHSDPDGHPFIERHDDLVSDLTLTLDEGRISTTIPPHAVVFLTVQR
ncbi:MAG: hypothetical protein KJ000_23545 [Pirellulaceae bacterium]|nr:hypothetical protein [Pirellulaceae bacterium]